MRWWGVEIGIGVEGMKARMACGGIVVDVRALGVGMRVVDVGEGSLGGYMVVVAVTSACSRVGGGRGVCGCVQGDAVGAEDVVLLRSPLGGAAVRAALRAGGGVVGMVSTAPSGRAHIFNIGFVWHGASTASATTVFLV